MMTAKRLVLIYKLHAVINEYAQQYNVSIREAFDALYKSQLYAKIMSGMFELHCRSDGYLAEELSQETGHAAGE